MTNNITSTFSESIIINASLHKVWDVVLHPNGQWGKAFGDGALIETTWNVGSSVIWRDMENNIVASGIVGAHRPREHLTLHYYDDAELNPAGPLGSYCEQFNIVEKSSNSSTLSIRIGALEEKDIAMHRDMWSEALRIIKACAERS